MTKAETDSLISPELNWFDSVVKSLEQASRLLSSSESEAISSAYPYLDSVLESLASFRLLVLRERLRDSYVIARCVYETSLNACFVLTDTDVLTTRASIHAKQKSLRNLVRTIEISDETIFKYEMKGSEEILQHPDHKKWLEDFTTKTGREVSSWTPENVPQRLEAVFKHFGSRDCRGLAFGVLLYRNASEIAHGTLFGTLFAWGAMEIGRPLTGPEDLAKFRIRELRHLIKLIAYSQESFARILATQLSAPDIAEAAINARTNYYEKRAEDA